MCMVSYLMRNGEIDKVLELDMKTLEPVVKDLRMNMISDKFPVVDFYKMECIKGSEIIAVVGRIGNEYIIANFRGDTKIVDREKLIEYGKVYKLSNYNIDDIKSNRVLDLGKEKRDIEYKTRIGVLEIILPYKTEDTLEIPENIRIPVKDVQYESVRLEIRPKVIASKIKRLIIGDNIKGSDGLLDFTSRNMEEIEFKGKINCISNNALKCVPNLKVLRIGEIDNKTTLICKGMKELEKVYIGEMEDELNFVSFKGCSKLDYRNIINDNIKVIKGYEIFNECFGVSDVSLPESLRELNIDAFNNSGIKKLIINSDITFINSSLNYVDMQNKGKRKFLKGVNNVEVEIRSQCATRYIRSIVDNRSVRIVENADDKLTRTNNKIRKAKLIGYNLAINEYPMDKEQLVNNIKQISEDAWFNSIGMALLRGNDIFDIADNGLYLKCVMNMSAYNDNVIYKHIGEKTITIINKVSKGMYRVSKINLDKEYVLKRVEIGDMSYFSKGYSIDIENIMVLRFIGTGFIVNGEIVNCENKGDQVEIELKDGSKRMV